MKSSGFFRSIIDVRPNERMLAALMCSYFFLVITSFWILKPLKKTLFIGHYAEEGFSIFGGHFGAPEAELLAKVMNMVVAALAVIVFSMVSRKLRRQQLTYVFTCFFIVLYGVFALWLTAPTSAGVWAFYLFGDLFSTLMVATFFTFLNDSMTSEAAKRLYGIVGFGGVLGGVFGSSAVGVWISQLSLTDWLSIAAVIGVVIMTVAWAAAANLARNRTVDREAPSPASGSGEDPSATAATTTVTTTTTQPTEEKSSDNPALAGARLVWRSSYLLAIVAIVGLYEIASTILDFQFTSAIFHFSGSDADARDQNFANVFAATNWLSMLVQLLLTSLVMRRFGLGVALMVLPVAIGLSSTGFLIAPTLFFGSLLSVSDNAFSYSINQSAKEALYVPTTVEEKYQAKAFIDMFVQRFAKAIGVGVGLLVGNAVSGFSGIPLLSFVVLPIVAIWGYASYYAGRKFRDLSKEYESGRDPGDELAHP